MVSSTGCTHLQCKPKRLLQFLDGPTDWITIAYSWEQGQKAYDHFYDIIKTYEQLQTNVKQINKPKTYTQYFKILKIF